MFTSTNYQAIADVLAEAMAECRSFEDKETRVFIHEWIISPLAEKFGQEDPDFDAESFSLACGYRGEVIL